MTINFYLKHADRSSLLSMHYLHRGVKYKYSTGLIVAPSDWDNGKKRFKSRRLNADINNKYLDRLDRACAEAHDKLQAEGLRISKKNIEFYFLINIGVLTDRTEFVTEYIEKFIDDRSKSGKYKKGSITVYETVQKKIQDYEAIKRKRFKFDDINLDFFYDFMAFLKPYNFKKNYLNKIVGTLTTFMNAALDEGLHENMKYKSRNFSAPKEEVFNVYLTIDELDQIYQLDLSGKPGMARTRDLFLIACYTGLRYGDISNLTKDNFQDGYITVTMQKGGKKKRLVIPVNPIVRLICAKYERLPKAVANQLMNRHIKDICELAKINEATMKDSKTLPKFKLVSTHTARRSFATNAFKMGVPAISIMPITGHTTESSFMKYIKISAEENARLMSENAFFGGRMKKA